MADGSHLTVRICPACGVSINSKEASSLCLTRRRSRQFPNRR